MKDCSICEAVENERVIYKDNHVVAFPTYIPIVPGHTIICPVRCVPAMGDLTDEELLALMKFRYRLKDALKKAFGAEGFNYAWNEGTMAGQSVAHLHLHMLPRKEGDTGIYEYEPRRFLYRPGSREKTPVEELAKVAELISNNL